MLEIVIDFVLLNLCQWMRSYRHCLETVERNNMAAAMFPFERVWSCTYMRHHQVDRYMFDALKSNEATSFLRANFTTAIQRTFGISWDVVRWEDLTKPLYSALAARLYISFQSRQSSIGIPRSLDDQAKFWKTHWRPNGNVVEFVRTVDRLTQGKSSSSW